MQVAITPFHAYPGPRDAGRDDLWILSRTPTVGAARYEALPGRLQAMGLDITRLDKTAP